MSRTDSNTVRRWLVNLVLFFVIGVLGCSMYFLWRLARLTYRIEQGVVAMSDDVKEVSGTAAQISRDVRQIRDELREVKVRIAESVPLAELDSAMDAVLEIGESLKADSVSLDVEAEQEIKYLLRALLFSGMKYDHRGKERPITRLYSALWAKYKTLRGTLVSTEDFIERVATESLLGTPYSIVDKEGNRHPLSEWMLEKLEKHRADSDARSYEAEITTTSDSLTTTGTESGKGSPGK